MWKKLLFVVLLLAVLIAMAPFRSPAVALMPDVTIKPLRSKANAIINLMGALGGIIYLIITTFLYKTTGDTYVSYLPLFLIVGGIIGAFTLRSNRERHTKRGRTRTDTC